MARVGDAAKSRCPYGDVVNNDTPEVTTLQGLPAWARVFAAVYDPFLWVGERAGLRAHRQKVLNGSRGHTLEIGGGTGLNLTYYPEDLDELIILEPDAAMRTRLERRLRRSGRLARLVDAPAERLPFPDGSLDTVVSTLVLCTVDAPDVALREIARVLRQEGQLLFLEHVRSESPTLARWQDRLAGPWRRFARGCRCNRATAELIEACGFEVETLGRASWHAMPPIVRPLVAGRASKTETATAATHSLVVHQPGTATANRQVTNV
jgi:SAM-dependent methyltransferase